MESPRAWGWTGGRRRSHRPGSAGIPTRVGMDRCMPGTGAACRNPHARGDGPVACPQPWSSRNPHARGDGPTPTSGRVRSELESPRAWGWTGATSVVASMRPESPRAWGWTGRQADTCSGSRNPHARGDGPALGLIVRQKQLGIPTRVGMDRAAGAATTMAPESPRAWGWTVWRSGYGAGDAESPRAWGWTVAPADLAG